MEKTKKKSTLGKGLDELLLSAAPIDDEQDLTQNKLTQLAIDVLQPGRYQPRRSMDSDALGELGESIAHQGVLQPLIVRAIAAGRYEIIAGERRWRAAKLAKLEQVPVIIRTLTDEEAMVIALVENIQRENLNPIEEAQGLARLMDMFALTHLKLAERLGKKRSTVTNLLRLLLLQDEVKTLLANGDIEMGHARALLTLEKDQQRAVAEMVIENNWSVREVEQWIREHSNSNEKTDNVANPATPPAVVDPNIQRLQVNLSEQLGAKVNISHLSTGKGKLVIHYNSVDELEGILAHIE